MQRSPWFAFLVCLAVGLIASVRADDRPNVVLILADDLGFDEYFGHSSGHWGEYFDAPLEENGRMIRSSGYIVDACTDRAIDFIERNNSMGFPAFDGRWVKDITDWVTLSGTPQELVLPWGAFFAVSGCGKQNRHPRRKRLPTAARSTGGDHDRSRLRGLLLKGER